MVLMCLFTTFITCPIIELIYPPHVRTVAARAAAALARGDSTAQGYAPVQVKGGDGISSKAPSAPATPDVEEPVGPIELMFSLEDMLLHAQVGVLVDRVEHMEGVMKLVMLFAPLSRASTLAVTAMRFLEPSFTDRDAFISLNAENKLLEVEEEITSVNLNALQRQREMNHKSSQPPEMLPLSMFVKAVGGQVSAFRVRGDPMHFPEELRDKVDQNSLNVVLFPWRESPYVEQLFWGSVGLVNVPLVLVVQTHVTVLSVPEGRARAGTTASSEHDGDTGRVLPGFVAGVLGGAQHKPSDASDTHTSSLPASPPTPGTALNKAVAENVTVKQVLAIITGEPADLLLLPFLLRCAQNPALHVTVLVASISANFPASLSTALDSLRRRVRSMKLSNFSMEQLGLTGNQVEAIIMKVATGPRYDIIVLSFSIPNLSANDAAGDGAGDGAPRKRRSSLSGLASSALLAMGEMVSPALATVEHRRLIGVPEEFVEAPLQAPELGTLGSALYNARLAPFLLVYHEPKPKPQARTSTIGTGAGSALSAAASMRLLRANTIIDATGFELTPPPALPAAGAVDGQPSLETIKETDEHGSSADLVALAETAETASDSAK